MKWLVVGCGFFVVVANSESFAAISENSPTLLILMCIFAFGKIYYEKK